MQKTEGLPEDAGVEGNQIRCLCELSLECCLSLRGFLKLFLEQMWWGPRPRVCPLSLYLGSDSADTVWLLYLFSWGCVLFCSLC